MNLVMIAVYIPSPPPPPITRHPLYSPRLLQPHRATPTAASQRESQQGRVGGARGDPSPTPTLRFKEPPDTAARGAGLGGIHSRWVPLPPRDAARFLRFPSGGLALGVFRGVGVGGGAEISLISSGIRSSCAAGGLALRLQRCWFCSNC
jgi:hypothetical protein